MTTADQAQDARALAALPTAAVLVVAVKEQDQEACHEALNATREELQALAVVLAAMIPQDRGIASLLGQVNPQQRMRIIASPDDWTDEDLVEAHRVHSKHRRNAKTVPGWAFLGEKEYQRRRHLRRKHMQEANAQALAARHNQAAS